MRAVAVENLGAEPRLMQLRRPVPRADQVLIKVSAAGMNPIDWKLAAGACEGAMANVLPFVLGLDLVGVVEELGAGVSRFRVNDRVFGQSIEPPLGEGSYAEYMVMGEKGALTLLSPAVSDQLGAALPTAAMTALSMIDSLELDPGSKILIVGASGGVGSFATQLAAAKGYTVLATARAQDAERLKDLGAFETFDARGRDLKVQVSAVHRHGIDALIDVVSDADAFGENVKLVCRGGYALTTIGSADPKQLRQDGILGGNFALKGSRELLQRLASLVESRELLVPIETTLTLEDVPASIAVKRHGGARGKTVIDICAGAIRPFVVTGLPDIGTK